MNTFGPVVPPAGPSPCRICVVAEAPGTEESESLRPLSGPSGRELSRMFRTLGMDLSACFKTNVFSRQPDGNNLALYGTTVPSPAGRSLGPLTLNPITYIADEFLGEIERLRAELRACDPHVVIALGNTATWALLGQQGISQLRGSVHLSDFLGPDRPLKVIPTYHPASILRQWEQRTVALADLEKAHGEAASREFQYTNTELWINPDIEALHEFDALHMSRATICSTDVETKRGQITCVSFAPTPFVSLAIPFWIDGPNPNYWATPAEELEAWRITKHWIERPDLVKVLQNGLYDTQYFARYGMCPKNFSEDTMLAHHSLWTELQKGLGFLGSIHTNVPSWKHMRTYRLEELTKKDD